jgi:hypothetical protein
VIRGTTPTHTFQIPFNTNLLKEIRISYAQRDAVVVEKTTEDCKLDGMNITVKLTQEETLRFSENVVAALQLRVLLNDGNVLATPVLRLDVGELLQDEVIQ